MGAGGEGGSEPVALVADSSMVESGALARVLEELGFRVICATTPLEMIHHLEHLRSDIRLVVVGSALGRHEGDELASFLAEAHPDIRRVLVARGACAGPSPARVVLGSVLEKPWTVDLVRSALAPELEERELGVGRAGPSE